jgi:hypothetical protein
MVYRVTKRPWLLGCIALASVLTISAGGLPRVVQISQDPYRDPDAQHATEVEPDTFSYGSTVVSAFQVGRIFGGGASNVGFSASYDGGHSWLEGYLPGTTRNAQPAGPYDAASDASVAYDARDNVWLISYLAVHEGPPMIVDVLVSRSTTGGATWEPPVVVAAQNTFFDKNWSVCDNWPSSPYYGNCYTEFDNASLGDLELMSTSRDGGQTWGPATPTTGNAHGLGGQPLVQPSGRVVVPFSGVGTLNNRIVAFISDNGGETWSSPVTVSTVSYHRPQGGIRAGIALPSAEIDSRGKVYVLWPDCRFEPGCTANAGNDLVFSTSTDGVSWSNVKRVPTGPIGSGVDHFVPGLAVQSVENAEGRQDHLAVTYYYYDTYNCGSSCQINVGFAASFNGGTTWGAPVKLGGPMPPQWLPNTSQGRMFGDYVSTSFARGPEGGLRAVPSFALAQAPRPNGQFREAIYAASLSPNRDYGGTGRVAEEETTPSRVPAVPAPLSAPATAY